MSTSWPNPNDALNFIVSIDGVPVASFAECILPAVSIDVIDYREGFDPAANVHKLPGLVSYGNLILRRGISKPPTTTTIWDWFSRFVSGTGSPTAIAVTLLDSKRDPVLKWSFTNCWPVKYESPVLNGKTSAIAIESVEIAVDGVQVSTMSG
jgi:phage tail-like protein